MPEITVEAERHSKIDSLHVELDHAIDRGSLRVYVEAGGMPPALSDNPLPAREPRTEYTFTFDVEALDGKTHWYSVGLFIEGELESVDHARTP